MQGDYDDEEPLIVTMRPKKIRGGYWIIGFEDHHCDQKCEIYLYANFCRK
ncbi:hypothetical protein FVEN_g12999 [Fusarium venenatum]|nr:hypothetical protein FVEN_g12999 [Fusarium venenatum]